MKRVKVSLLMSLVFVLVLSLSTNASQESTKMESQKSELEIIADKYEIGEPISSEDMEVIMKNAKGIEDLDNLSEYQLQLWDTNGTYRLFGTARNSTSTVEADLAGRITVTIGATSLKTIGTLNITTIRGATNKSGIEYKVVGWGASAGGIWTKVIDEKQIGSDNTKNYELNVGTYNPGIIAYFEVFATGFVEYPGGRVNVVGNFTKE